jgi:hypothetical protein
MKHDEVTMYDIRLVKLVNGDMVLGKWNQDKGVISGPAILQTIPTQQGGMQMLLLPFGYPFDQEMRRRDRAPARHLPVQDRARGAQDQVS